jgi:hypothetical protein
MGTGTVRVWTTPPRRRSRPTVDEHDVPLLNTLLPQDGSEHLDLIEQLLVRDALLGVGYWAVVEDSGEVTVAGEDMTVDAVVTRGYLAVWEPLPVGVGVACLENLGRPGKGGRGLLVPVEVFCLVAPEALGVVERAVVDLVLEVGHGC